MPKFTLTYFDLKGLGEGIRLLLAYGGQEFEDRRVAIQDWAEMKWKTPYGSMPVLEIDGKEYAQSLAICQYLGQQYGLAGADFKEDLIINQNINFVMDLRYIVAMAYYEEHEETRARKLEHLDKNIYPHMLPRLDTMIKENGGHIACGKLTWADFLFAGLYDTLKGIMNIPDIDEKYPSFQQLRDTVYSLPKLKEYLDSAPEAPSTITIPKQ